MHSTLTLPFAVPVVTVRELNARVRTLLENQLETVWVAGELSNVKKAPSGHWYFCLKDAEAQVDCCMFRGRAQFLDFRPENGQQVEVRARVTLYEARGQYQLVVDEIRRAGLGALYEAFEKLKARLDAEGLFAPERKRRLPAFPRAIGVVTSPVGAAVRDVLTTLARRAPMLPVVVYPTQVQGEGAGAQVARAIATANARRECDVLIVCRGGGSLEDLWAFNEEVVARAIVGSAIPVVSGVGHETDFEPSKALRSAWTTPRDVSSRPSSGSRAIASASRNARAGCAARAPPRRSCAVSRSSGSRARSPTWIRRTSSGAATASSAIPTAMCAVRAPASKRAPRSTSPSPRGAPL